MVPLPPERSAVVAGGPLPLAATSQTILDVDYITPSLPESYDITISVNGESGNPLVYPQNQGDVIWSNGSTDINFNQNPSDKVIEFLFSGDLQVNTFGLFINGEEYQLTWV